MSGLIWIQLFETNIHKHFLENDNFVEERSADGRKACRIPSMQRAKLGHSSLWFQKNVNGDIYNFTIPINT